MSSRALPDKDGFLFDSKAFIKTLPNQPGVYRMLNKAGEVIYVGKARNLKKRVASYFSRQHDSPKTAALVAQIAKVDITITLSENEALILENTLIKQYQPHYNIVFKDDKSYPYLLMTDHDFPQLISHRGTRRNKGRYFGPYPTLSTARTSLHLLQKIFRLRNCEDSVFQHRARPCLQYQIHRCSAPCVGFIDKEHYQQDVRHAELFLQGKNQAVLNEMKQQMDEAANALDFEKAAVLRDRITILRRVQEQQYVHAKTGNVDVLAVVQEVGVAVLELLVIRDGQILGNKEFFITLPLETSVDEILSEFISQHYLEVDEPKPIPTQIIVSHALTDADWLAATLSERAGKKITLLQKVRHAKQQWLQLAYKNAEHALKTHIAQKTNIEQRFAALAENLNLPTVPQRLECFDISHSLGEATVASCVVFNQQGPLKNDYRRFNIEGITPGDDYAAMHQALQRRYTRLRQGEGKLPDVLIIDGGKGQLNQAQQVLTELNVEGVILLGIAKGVSRKPGLEQIFIMDKEHPILLHPDSPALHLLQHIRDEAHRFAITAHRNRRVKTRQTSPLQNIPGVGPQRRRQLLQHFGGLQELQRVSAEEIAKVDGISLSLAQRIFDALHR